MKYSVDQILSHEWPLSLDPDFDGCCPCAEIQGDGFSVEVHCWRVCRKCEFSGVHVSGDISLSDAHRVFEHIIKNNGWSDRTEWELNYLVPTR